MTTKKNPFIEGFREPTLSKNSFLVLADVRGDGEGKLVIWSEQQNQLIVYKGSNRQLQKSVKVKNVSGIIQYQDQERNAQTVIGLSAQNGFYIFRGLSQSFRLRVPDIFAEAEEQIIWSQYENDPNQLGVELQKIDQRILSQTAKYYLGTNTIQRKKELIYKVFDQGINEKDSISAMALLRQTDMNFLGNVILGTQLKRLYILDNYGHAMISRRIMPFTPSIILAHGTLTDKYVIICIGRQGEICIYMQKDLDQPIQKIRNNTRIVSACLSYPDLVMVGDDQTLGHYTLTNSNSKLLAKKYSVKFGTQPIKVQFLRVKGQKMTIVAFQNQVRFYNQKQLNYTFITDFKLYNVIWGSFAREQCCLILLYQNAGFEVLILHRQFSIKQNYGSNKTIKQQFQSIPIPKKTSHFLSYWNDDDADEAMLYKHYERGLKLLKWRTLRQKYLEGGNKSKGTIQINSKVLGLGPIFNIQLQIQNISEELLFDVGIMLSFDTQKIQIIRGQTRLAMIPPYTPTPVEMQVKSLSLKNQNITVQLISGNNIVSNIVFIPSCEQFGGD